MGNGGGQARMNLEVVADPGAVAQRAAAVVAAEARAAVAARGRFVFAVSGGQTPRVMLKALAAEDVPWQGVHLAPVDERVAPAGHPDRNLTLIRAILLEQAPPRPNQVHSIPVTAPDPHAA